MGAILNARILHANLFTLSPEGFWGLPIIGKGKPGVGKTHNIQAAGKRVTLPFWRLSPGECGEGQFGVVPVPGADGYLHYPAPDWAELLKDGGIIFVDEINTAPPALQAPLLGLVQLRRLGNHLFNKRVRILGAMNDTEDAAGGWDLAPALANRFGHFDFEGLEPNAWVVALYSGFAHTDDAAPISAELEEQRVLNAWAGAVANARGLVGGFITRRPEMLHRQPKSASKDSSHAWPSHRTVEYAVHVLASSKIHGLSESDTDTFMTAFVGLPWVQEFATWRTNLDLPDPAEVLDGKVTFTHDDRRVDRTLAVLGSCAALVVPEKAEKRIDRAKACWQLINEMRKGDADAVIPAAHALCRARLVGEKFATNKVLSDLKPLLDAAGVI